MDQQQEIEFLRQKVNELTVENERLKKMEAKLREIVRPDDEPKKKETQFSETD